MQPILNNALICHQVESAFFWLGLAPSSPDRTWHWVLVVTAGAVFVLIFALVYFREEIRGWLRRIDHVGGKHKESEFQIRTPIDNPGNSARPQHGVAQEPTRARDSELDNSPELLASSSSGDESPWPDYWRAFEEKDVDAAEVAYKRIREDANTPENRSNFDAMHLTLRYKDLGDRDALVRLEQLIERTEFKCGALTWLGFAYLETGQPQMALNAYEKAHGHAISAKDRNWATYGWSKSLRDLGKLAEARELIERELQRIGNDPLSSQLYVWLAGVYEDMEERELRILALETAAAKDPLDYKVRFDAAYQELQMKWNPLSIINFSELVEKSDDDGSMEMNNLGVALLDLELPISAMSMYERAAELGNTLSMANLASQLLSAGFAVRAEEWVNKAREQQDYHANNDKVIGEKASKIDAEKRKLEKIRERAKLQQRFLVEFMEAYSARSEAPLDLIGRSALYAGTSEVSVQQNGSMIQLQWTRGSIKHTVSGKIRNMGARVAYTQDTEGERRLIALTPYARMDGFAYWDQNAKTFKIMVTKDNDCTFVDLVENQPEADSASQ